MSRYVELSSLSRRELENLLLTEHGALARVLEAVRSTTEPNWKVRREVERIIEEAVDRRPFVVAYARGSAVELSRTHARRNEAQWSRWGEVEA
jgi:trehalose-6-phosphatase